ncbi:MAG TPA: alpha/beta fold hydrolase [Pirellulales bacterium]|jgi:pimeloyl-ACP methyl ester carboxylesterase|nr:alpha/beta fold hydrolase [Pirellulales bacterium]
MSRPRYLSPLFALVGVCLAHAGCDGAAGLPKTQTFDSGGVKIAYSVLGQGEPVVLIHGWLSAAGINWTLPGTSARLAKELSVQVIALDVRGHGLSDKPTEEEAYGAEMVEDVVRLLDHLKIEKAHVVGYSMGGILAANLAVRHPERVLSVTLGGMAWLKTGGAAQWLFSRIGKDDRDAKAHAVCGRSLARLALSEDEIKSTDVPVTVLVGAKDDLIKRLYVAPLEKVRSDWPIIEIKDANHINCILKEQFQDEIVAALKRHGVEGRFKPN